MTKRIVLLFSFVIASNAEAQSIQPVYGLEGAFLFGGLSNVTGYDGSFWFNGSFWVDFVGTDVFRTPTIGVKIKLNYNYYDMSNKGFDGGDLVVSETTIPVLLKVCLSSKTNNWSEKHDGETKYFTLEKDLFLFAGPQIGFPSISGGTLKSDQSTDYALVVGGELYINNSFYISLYRQIGMSVIYSSQTDIRLSGTSIAIGFRLL